MKVLLISPNIETLPDPVFPIGLAYVASALKQNNIDYQVLDLCFIEDYASAIASAVHSYQPDIFGLSLRNLDNVSYPNYISYLPFYKKIIQTIRKLSSGIVVLGGSGFSLIPDKIRDYLEADYGIAGEGESSFVQLIQQLAGSNQTVSIPETKIIPFHSGMIKDLDTLTPPDRTVFDNDAYFNQGGMVNLQTKRGCPFKCVYCTYPVVEGKNIRVRKPKKICDEIEQILSTGVENIFFVDNEFNYPAEHAGGICKEIIQRNLSVKWSCYANPGFFTEDLVELMLEAGCTGLEFGSDAANETMLNNLGKNFTLNDLEDASTICRKLDMNFCHSLLLGGPGETMDTVQETFDNMLDMGPPAVICMVGIRVFPGTRLAETAKAEGVSGPEEDFLEPVFYLSPDIKDHIISFIETFAKQHKNWIFPGLNININANLQKKLRRFGIKGPLWEYMKKGQQRKRHS